MNYLDELFNRYAELWTVHGDCMKREPFKIAISEALEKQKKDLHNALMLIVEQPIPIQTLLFQVQRLFENYKLDDL